MENHFLNKLKFVFWMMSISTIGAQTAIATEIEEIVVTASKRGEQYLQDIPFAVQALSGNKLESIGANSFEDFFRLIPGLAVLDQGSGDKRYILRGVNSAGAGTVSLYLDEVIITGENAQDGGGRQPDIKLFDIDRVEVLKGPQGTTFGSSALAGTIRYITSKPNVQKKELKVKAALRDLDGADSLGGQIEIAGSIPIIEDKLAIRAAGYYLSQDGFIDNNFGNGVNSDDTVAGRVSLLYAPAENLNISLMTMHQSVESDGPAYFNLLDSTPTRSPLPEYRQGDLSSNPRETETDLFNAMFEYTGEYGVITGTASRLDRDSVLNRDASLAVGPNSVISQPKQREVNSYELRFSSDWESPVQVLAGVFKQEESRFYQSSIFPSDPVTGVFTEVTGFSLDRNVDTSVDELAFFAELSMDITERLTLTGGFRWFDIEVDEVATAIQGFSGAPAAGQGPALSFSEDGVIGTANISYKLNDDVMGYAQWTQGFRSGGANDQTAAAIAGATVPAGFESDSLDNYEIGIKGSWLENKIVANLAYYYIDWADIQVSNQAQHPTNPTIFFEFRGNGGAADIYGIELDITARPVEELELGFVASYTSAELSEDNPIASTGMEGDSVPYIPEFTFTLSGQYVTPLSSGDLDGFIGADMSYVDERSTEYRPSNPLQTALESYTLVNFRAGVTSESNNWTASLTINNAFGDDSVVDVFRIIPGLIPDGFIPQKPRTISLSFSKRF